MSDAEGIIACPFDAKNCRYFSLNSYDFILYILYIARSDLANALRNFHKIISPAHNKFMQINCKEAADAVQGEFTEYTDVLRMDFNVGGRAAALFYIDGFVDKIAFESSILRPLKRQEALEYPYADTINQITALTTPMKTVQTPQEAAKIVSEGDIALVIDGAEGIFIFSERAYQTRGIQEPPVTNVLRGPREGFVEDVKINMTMLRRKLKTPKLTFKKAFAGKYTDTPVIICYIDGVASPDVVDEVEKRINSIDMDGVVESSYIARYLETNYRSLFTQVGTSEKPDIIAAKMLEGRVAIIVDGSPMVLTVPFILFEHFQASEDYYIKSFRASFIRIVRLMALVFAIALPGAYVALQEYQYQMFPLKFLISIMNSIYGIPFTPTLEMLSILIIFEILNEASVRMPRYVGMALSVVGAIVLGETAVNAGLFSTPAILVISISTIGLYCVPDATEASSILRVLFVAIAGVAGLMGLILAALALIAYLADLRSFGTSYLAPFAPLIERDWQDGLIKESVRDMTERPYSIPTWNRVRRR